jgi:hypothetical protein
MRSGSGPGGRVQVKVSPRLQTNNGETCLAGALQHQGLILQPSFLVRRTLRRAPWWR